MRALVTDQGTAAHETGLCEKCYSCDVWGKANQGYAREMAAQSDDINPTSDFVDCTGNTALECCICGEPK